MIFVVFFVKNIWLSTFFVWNIVLYCFNGGYVGWDNTVNLFLGIVMFMVSRHHFKSFRAEFELKPLIWVALLSMFWMILQKLRIDPVYTLANGMGENMYTPQWAYGSTRTKGFFRGCS